MNKNDSMLFDDIKIRCPVCKSENTETIQKIIDIPYFPNLWMFSFRCKNCHYKHSDFINLSISDPMRYVYHASCKEDYTTKIVRGANGTIRLPELGVTIEPGPNADGFINNIEGILRDVQGKAKFLLKTEENKEKRRRIEDFIKLVERYIENFLPIDIIVEDPSGNSIIIPYDEKKLERIKLSNEEAEKLSIGMYMFENVKKKLKKSL